MYVIKININNRLIVEVYMRVN